MKRMTLTIVAVALVATMVTSALAQSGRAPRAQRGEREMMEPGERQLERMTERLDLTEAQQTTIQKLQTESRRQALELRKEMARLRNEIQGEMLKDKPAERTVVQLHEKLGELQTKLKVHRVKTRLAIREQLTPEQRDQMLLQGDGRGGSPRRGGQGGQGREGFCCLHGPACQDGPGRGQRAGR
jgi:Spy/CpxP family protein refolding chaperone